MNPQENLTFPNMDKDLKLKLSIVPFHVSEMSWFTSFGQESQKSEYEVFLTSPFSLWSPWCNTRSCWKLSSVPLGTWTTGERGNLCPECPAGLTLLQPSTLLFLSSCWGLRASICPSAWLPTGSQAWQFRPFLVLQPFGTSSLLPKCFIFFHLFSFCLLSFAWA